VPKVKTVKL
jgi:hypothetical protein